MSRDLVWVAIPVHFTAIVFLHAWVVLIGRELARARTVTARRAPAKT